MAAAFAEQTLRIADGMRDRLGRGEEVEWCGEVKLTPTGLRIGRDGGREVKWEDIRVMRAGDREFRLWVHGSKKAVLFLRTTAWNYFPGLEIVTT